MPDLIAQGAERRHRWRRRLLSQSTPIFLGRDCGAWSVPWDPCISRSHASLVWNGRRLRVEKMPTASNPIFFQGRDTPRFRLSLGQHFVIGDTQFTLVDHGAEVSLAERRPADQRTFSGEYLRRLQFRHAHSQIQALSRLPEIVASAQTEGELYPRVIHLLLTGILNAKAAALVQCTESSAGAMTVLHWDRLDQADQPFQPSGHLIAQAFSTGEAVVHVWRSADSEWRRANREAETIPVAGSGAAPQGGAGQDDFDWAFCVPIPGVDCRGQVLYVAGADQRALSDDGLQDMLKFVELVATTVGNVCDLRRLEKQTTALSQFFSPPVRQAVAAGDPEIVLAPRETEVSVLFCDLRGFSRRSEESAGDLLELLRRVSEALGIATHEILANGGVIGDFHGDAAMGFWGWPIAHPDCVPQACRAAVQIQRAFEQASLSGRSALSGFQVGMGVATGPAVAGKIGTQDQVKVTVFGPVVNLAARLEGMTRLFELPILIDETTATAVLESMRTEPARTIHLVVRPLPKVRPYGLRTAHRVYTLATGNPPTPASDESRPDDARYVLALQHFELGDWGAARRQLQTLPADDPSARFLARWIEKSGPNPPHDWDGVIPLDRK